MAAPCSCELAGFCERHRMRKSDHLFKLCRTREDYRKMWDMLVAILPAKVCTSWRQTSDKHFVCTDCERPAGAPSRETLPKNRPCLKRELFTPSPPPPPGPGTELSLLLKSLGIAPKKSCKCGSRQAQMDHWGPTGCETHFDTIVKWLKESYGEATALEKVRAATLAVTTGLSFSLSLTDPFGSLVREAIRRDLERKAAETTQALA